MEASREAAWRGPTRVNKTCMNSKEEGALRPQPWGGGELLWDGRPHPTRCFRDSGTQAGTEATSVPPASSAIWLELTLGLGFLGQSHGMRCRARAPSCVAGQRADLGPDLGAPNGTPSGLRRLVGPPILPLPLALPPCFCFLVPLPLSPLPAPLVVCSGLFPFLP